MMEVGLSSADAETSRKLAIMVRSRRGLCKFIFEFLIDYKYNIIIDFLRQILEMSILTFQKVVNKQFKKRMSDQHLQTLKKILITLFCFLLFIDNYYRHKIWWLRWLSSPIFPIVLLTFLGVYLCARICSGCDEFLVAMAYPYLSPSYGNVHFQNNDEMILWFLKLLSFLNSVLVLYGLLFNSKKIQKIIVFALVTNTIQTVFYILFPIQTFYHFNRDFYNRFELVNNKSGKDYLSFEPDKYGSDHLRLRRQNEGIPVFHIPCRKIIKGRVDLQQKVAYLNTKMLVACPHCHGKIDSNFRYVIDADNLRKENMKLLEIYLRPYRYQQI